MMNRRHFLQHAGVVSLAGLAATMASIQSVQAADYKTIVIVFLSGGYDGNNILIPVDGAFNDYEKARPSLALPKDSLIRLQGSHIGHQFALSPASRPFASLFEQKRMAIVANAIYIATIAKAIHIATITGNGNLKQMENFLSKLHRQAF